MITATEVISLMNKYGQNRTPFLFGVDYEMKNGFFVTNPINSDNLYWEIDGIGNSERMKHTYKPGNSFIPRYIDYDEYEKAFGIIRKHLMRGDTFLANLTMRTPIDTDFSFYEIFKRSRSRFKIMIPDKFVCFSPEIFINISSDNTISSHPMKGTISGRIPDAANKILSDYKECAEHMTIVDFIRSDLSRVSHNVNVQRLRYIDELQTSKGPVLQVSSEISGILDTNWHERLGDIFQAVLPAGSICGAPKTATLKAIAEAECHNRGFYTGVFGFYDGKSIKSAVMIRFMEKVGDNIYFHSGGGITINSNCHDEYEEVCQKVYIPW